MNQRNWRAAAVAVLSLGVFNLGFTSAAQAGIVGTDALVQTTRDANLQTIQAELSRDAVRANLARLGVDAADVERRVAGLSDAELATLAQRMQDAPAGGDGLLAVIGLTFVVLMILEFVGVIDIFKRVPAR